MKVLHVISSLAVGGAQKLVADLLPIISTEGIDVELLVFQEVENHLSEKIKKAGITIHSLPANAGRWKRMMALRKALVHYQLVHVHLFPTLYWVALANIGIHVPLVFTEHSTSNRRRGKFYLRPLEQFIYSRYQAVISISEQTQQALLSWLKPQNTNAFSVVENGIDLSAYTPRTEVKRNPQIVMVSRFVPAKDQATLIKAMAYVNKQLSLLLVGDGETMARCKELSNQVGVSDRVQFLGARSDVSEWLWQSMIGVQSSHWEGFGLTAVEMMAAGLPVVASDVEGLKQVVAGAGMLFNRGDEMQLAQIINELYEDTTLRNDTIVACQKRAQQYSIVKSAQAIIERYNQLI